MARQRKYLTINKDKIRKTSAVELTVDAPQSQGLVRAIHPVVTYPNLGSKGGNGVNFDFTSYYGKGYDDITNRVYYTAKALLRNTNAFTEETQHTYLKNGFRYFAQYLELFRHSVRGDLTQNDITPRLIEQYLLHLKGSEFKPSFQKALYTHLKSLLVRMKEKGYWPLVDDSLPMRKDRLLLR